MNEIYIGQPYVEESADGLYRLCSNITCEGIEEKLFVEVEPQYKDYLTWERSDAFLFLCIPIAVREGYNIRCEAPVSEMFLHNLNTILIPAITQGDARAKKIDIIADSAPELDSAGAVGTGVSAGVDSTYTIMQYTDEKYSAMKLTHLLVGSVSSDLWGVYEDDNLNTWQKKYASTFKRYEEVSEYTGLPIVKVFTNFVPFLIRRREQNVWYKHVNVHIYITMGMILTLKKLFSVYYFASAYDYAHFNLKDNLSNSSADYELLLMYTVSSHKFMSYAAGGSVDRIEKTVALTDYPLAQQMLHPCFNEGKKNCSSPVCNKCLRALLTFDYFGKLDKMSKVWDVERYRKNKQEYLVTLIRDKENVNFTQLYDWFIEKYPEEMKAAQLVYDDNTAPVTKEEYNSLELAYDKVMQLVLKDEPRKYVVDYFKGKGVQKLYFEGDIEYYKLMSGILKNDVELLTSKNANPNDCDAIFVGGLRDKDIESEKASVSALLNGSKDIYTFRTLFAKETILSTSRRIRNILFTKKEEETKDTELDKSMVDRKKFLSLARGYEAGLQLISQDSPRQTVVEFFKSKGVKKLFYANPSKFGKYITKLIADDIEVVTEKTGDINDCDAAFVGVTLNHSIKKAKIYIACKKNKAMETYTFKEIKRACK